MRGWDLLPSTVRALAVDHLHSNFSSPSVRGIYARGTLRLQIRDLSLVLTHVHIPGHDAGRLASDGSDATERGTTGDLGSQVFKEVQARSSRTRYLISRIPSRRRGGT